MTQYFDPTTGFIKRQVYEWDDTGVNLYVADGYVDANYVEGSSGALDWDSLTDWDTGTGSLYTIGSGDAITFRSEIKDLGRIDYVNPLCEVDATGVVNVKVLAADSIDSSSQLPGDPQITGGQEQTLYGLKGRYFQYLVEVSDDSDAVAEIRSVSTQLLTTKREEFVIGDSSTHAGTQAERLAPLQRSYSRLIHLGGNAKQTLEDAPFITVGDLTVSPAEARYTVHKVQRDVAVEDSSTVIGITDQAQNQTINLQTGHPQTTTRTYKWSPASIEFNVVNADPGTGLYYGRGITVTDTDDSIRFSTTDITEPSTSQDYTLEGWVKIAAELATDSDPQYQHPSYFVELYANSGEYIRLSTSTVLGKLNFAANYNGTTTTIYSSYGATNPEGDWIYWRIRRESGTVYANIISTETQLGTSNTWGYNSGHVNAGDLGSNDPAALYMDDIRWSETSRTAVPTAPFTVDANTLVLVTGALVSTSTIAVTDVVTTDAEVNLHIVGLPALRSDEDGNIVLA
jgi:hypothetical protein